MSSISKWQPTLTSEKFWYGNLTVKDAFVKLKNFQNSSIKTKNAYFFLSLFLEINNIVKLKLLLKTS